jgi:hypothetical protein
MCHENGVCTERVSIFQLRIPEPRASPSMVRLAFRCMQQELRVLIASLNCAGPRRTVHGLSKACAVLKVNLLSHLVLIFPMRK